VALFVKTLGSQDTFFGQETSLTSPDTPTANRFWPARMPDSWKRKKSATIERFGVI
jgi:hypothetical protein